QEVSAPPVVSPSLLLRFLRSQFAMGGLALAGVLSSALVVGYYDSVSQAEPNVETRDAAVSLVPSAQAETPDKVTSQPEPGAAELPSPMASPAGSSSTEGSLSAEDSPSAEGSSSIKGRPSGAPASGTPRASRARVGSSNSKLKANRRRLLGHQRRPQQRNERRRVSVNSESIATNQRSHPTNQSSQTRNQTLQVRSQQRESENAHPKEESKVAAMFKKTGRLLTRPFKF
ncbi:MAG: hypothetical protein ACREBG_07150, partial [Pyrinomonadaceae bacterium]